MSFTQNRFYRYRSLFTFLTAFFLSALIGTLLVYAICQNHLLREHERASSLVKIQASHLSHEIDNLLSITQSFRALLVAGNGSIEELSQITPQIVGNSPIRNVSLAPGGIVSYVYPLAGNEEALGHNLLEDPDRILEAAMAKESRQLTLSGPYELRQGGLGIIGRLPIYLKNADSSDSFWGFVCVIIDIPNKRFQSNLLILDQQRYAYELWRTSPETDKKQIIMSSTQPILYEPVCEIMELPNSVWELDIAPVNGWLPNGWIVTGFILVLVFSLLTSLLAYNIRQLAVSRNDLTLSLNQQTANYQIMYQLNEDLRAFRHDLNNHMISLSGLLDKGNLEAAKSYINSLHATLLPTMKIVNTENYVFDSLLAQKTHEAIQKGIHVEQTISLSRQLSIEHIDWCILFGNALDNAIEACLLCKAETPELSITVKYEGNILKTSISNTAALVPAWESNSLFTNKEDKKNHGLGLKQIRGIVKKYHGTMETDYEDGIFTLRFLLFYV